MTKELCNELLNDTISQHESPEIHNSDQWSQYKSELYLNTLKDNEIQISMDGKGRAIDNIYIERFWRSLKQEKIYLNPPKGGLELYHIIKKHVHFYNCKRRHNRIGDITPKEKYLVENKPTKINYAILTCVLTNLIF